MASKKTTLSNAILDHLLRAVPLPAPSSLELALFTVAPDAGSDGTEVSASDDAEYSRQPITFGLADNGSSKNDAIVQFPAAEVGANYNIAGVALVDSVGGNQLYFGNLTKNITEGDELTFSLDAITITEN